MEERFDLVNGIKIHSLQLGAPDAEIVIFLHGFPEYSGAWQEQMVYLAAQGYYVIAPDQRGYNLSDKPDDVHSYMMDHLVTDIAALIGILTTGKVILVGHDWGGAVAWEVALRHPHLLRQLIILNMPHPIVMIETLKTSLSQQLKSWYQAMFQLPWFPELLLKSFNCKVLSSMLISTARKHTFSEDQLKQYRVAWQQPGALTAMLNWYRASRYYRPGKGMITMPTLVIWGKQDAFLNAGMARRSVRRCAKGKLVMIDDATHWLHHEQSTKISQLILNFIKTREVQS
ncbi:alpha/beta fold hydrolase [Chitinophaga rhizophila]|uniref:Alpha/beta hydrolase n=1 Tax=Chitinophaga rhizophila TaxID=2866212 RepID=A0ABS7GBD5_9BACT|nr:alpha/beta hydrolase [Chitinophaga rhizophila]MBW8684646.1 alpha/beta hydrolase [Chitinophaga rhizophila]